MEMMRGETRTGVVKSEKSKNVKGQLLRPTFWPFDIFTLFYITFIFIIHRGSYFIHSVHRYNNGHGEG
jgi:hypothetical protein